MVDGGWWVVDWLGVWWCCGVYEKEKGENGRVVGFLWVMGVMGVMWVM